MPDADKVRKRKRAQPADLVDLVSSDNDDKPKQQASRFESQPSFAESTSAGSGSNNQMSLGEGDASSSRLPQVPKCAMFNISIL